MKKLPLFPLLAALCLLSPPALLPSLFAAARPLTPENDAPNIAAATPTTVRIIIGETRDFSDDSPRGQQPVSTAATVAQLTTQFSFLSGKIEFFRRDGRLLAPDDIPAAGDKIVATSPPPKPISDETDGRTKKIREEIARRLAARGGAEDKTAPRTYDIETIESALAGRLMLYSSTGKFPPAIAANEASDLTLYFTAGQRSPGATVTISVPAGINVTMDNAFVRIAERDEVPLGGLAGTAAGTVAITGDAKTGQTITFAGLDLRPPHKPDVRLRISGVQLAREGAYAFKSTYTTAEPKKLTSPGTRSEQALLFVIDRNPETRKTKAYGIDIPPEASH